MVALSHKNLIFSSSVENSELVQFCSLHFGQTIEFAAKVHLSWYEWLFHAFFAPFYKIAMDQLSKIFSSQIA